MSDAQGEITLLLLEIQESKGAAVDALFPLVYEELRQVARSQLRKERAGHTLSATSLVHEAYIRLVDQTRVEWQNRAHFFAIAARAMRRILINYANARLAEKRGGGEALITLTDGSAVRETRAEQLLDLDEALDRLKALDERQAQVVELRFFGGLKHEEIGQVLGVSVPTVRRDWRLARAWLGRELAA